MRRGHSALQRRRARRGPAHCAGPWGAAAPSRGRQSLGAWVRRHSLPQIPPFSSPCARPSPLYIADVHDSARPWHYFPFDGHPGAGAPQERNSLIRAHHARGVSAGTSTSGPFQQSDAFPSMRATHKTPHSAAMWCAHNAPAYSLSAFLQTLARLTPASPRSGHRLQRLLPGLPGLPAHLPCHGARGASRPRLPARPPPARR